jgi:hypothetical protein
MRIWLIGADMRGCEVLRQFRKNNNIEVIVSDSTERPRALVDKLIDKVNYVEPVTSVNINHLARRIRPDLILIDPGEAQRSMGRVSGGVAFTESLLNEMPLATIPALFCNQQFQTELTAYDRLESLPARNAPQSGSLSA